MVGDDVARLIEPKGGHLIEYLALEGKGAEHAIEGADAIGYDDDALAVVGAVVVAHFALVVAAQSRHRMIRQGEGEALGENLGVGHPPCSERARSMMLSTCESAWFRSSCASMSAAATCLAISVSALSKVAKSPSPWKAAIALRCTIT